MPDACYAPGDNASVIKPMEFSRVLDVVRAFEDFWMKTAVLPLA